MTKAALLPFTGDPFLFKESLRLFNEVWGKEVDKLYIYCNANIPIEVSTYIIGLINHNEKIYAIAENKNIDHGPAINNMLEVCTEDLIMLVEEDGFIFKKGQVEKCFNYIESGEFDVVGSERGCTTDEVIRTTSRKFGCELPGFWPNFFFCKRKDLLMTDRHFQAKSLNKGDYIKEIDLTITDEVAPMDTFVWTSIQLRNMGLRVKLVDQYHSVIEDIQHHTQIKGVFDRKAPWIHIGSLSGWQHVLFDDLPARLGEVEEWERRASAWLMFWENAQEGLPLEIKDFSDKYKAGLDRLITEYTLSPTRVKLRSELYRNLLS